MHYYYYYYYYYCQKNKRFLVTQRNVFDGTSLDNVDFEVSLEGLRKTCIIIIIIIIIITAKKINVF